jgi:hypothetical protein
LRWLVISAAGLEAHLDPDEVAVSEVELVAGPKACVVPVPTEVDFTDEDDLDEADEVDAVVDADEARVVDEIASEEPV